MATKFAATDRSAAEGAGAVENDSKTAERTASASASASDADADAAIGSRKGAASPKKYPPAPRTRGPPSAFPASRNEGGVSDRCDDDAAPSGNDDVRNDSDGESHSDDEDAEEQFEDDQRAERKTESKSKSTPSPSVESNPPRLFRDPSDELAELYERLDKSLEDQEDASNEASEARRNFEEARRWMNEAEERLRRNADDVRIRAEEMREGELREPCEWNFMYARLRNFREEHGHAEPCLWPRKRRRAKRSGGPLTKRAKAEGSGEGGGGDAQDARKNADGSCARQEKAEEITGGMGVIAEGEDELESDGTDVGDMDGNEKELADWLRTQRRKYKSNNMKAQAPHRVRALEKLDITWDRQKARWAVMYDKLQEFKNTHGHTDVPKDYTEDPTLYKWVCRQRAERANLERAQNGSRQPNNATRAQIRPVRKQLLDAIGFKWSTSWEDHFADLCAFRDLNGHCDVPNRYKPDPSLGNWVYNQRKFYSQQLRGVAEKYGGVSLTVERIRRLEGIGFRWNCGRFKGWEERFQELLAFQDQFGHMSVSRSGEHKSLGLWVRKQKGYFRKHQRGERSPITEEQVQKLASVGLLVWTPHGL